MFLPKIAKHGVFGMIQLTLFCWDGTGQPDGLYQADDVFWLPILPCSVEGYILYCWSLCPHSRCPLQVAQHGDVPALRWSWSEQARHRAWVLKHRPCGFFAGGSVFGGRVCITHSSIIRNPPNASPRAGGSTLIRETGGCPRHRWSHQTARSPSTVKWAREDVWCQSCLLFFVFGPRWLRLFSGCVISIMIRNTLTVWHVDVEEGQAQLYHCQEWSCHDLS